MEALERRPAAKGSGEEAAKGNTMSKDDVE
jgi:hypothetical protein